jgi:transposase-like protein
MRKRDFERMTRASEQAKEALKTRDMMIRTLHESGYTVRAIAEAAGLSHGRVGQIVKEAQEEGKHD